MGRLMRVRSHASGQLGHLLNQLICMFARAGRHLDRLTCGPPWRRCTGGRWGVGVHGCAADRVQRNPGNWRWPACVPSMPSDLQPLNAAASCRPAWARCAACVPRMQGQEAAAEAEWNFACTSITTGCSKYQDQDWLLRIR